jgi:hypothetical protein
MPRYLITRILNERSAKTFDFEAADDEEALRLLHDETCLDARLEHPGGTSVILSGILDETRGLDKFEDGALLMLVDELSLKSQMPYSAASRDFAAKVAALGKEGAWHDAIETLEALIAEARALCGIEISTS